MEEEAVYTNYLTISWFFRPPPINGVQQHRIPAESKEAAQEMQRKHRRDREDGIIGGRGYTVKTWMPVYNQAVVDQGTAQDSTVEVYEQKDRLYISPYLGNLAISDVTTARVRQWFARDLVGKDGKLLSFNTRKNCFALLSAAFNLAVNEDLIRKNPCDGVKLVRPEGEDEYRGYAFNPGECASSLSERTVNSASQSQIGFFGIWLCDALNPTLSDRLLGSWPLPRATGTMRLSIPHLRPACGNVN